MKAPHAVLTTLLVIGLAMSAVSQDPAATLTTTENDSRSIVAFAETTDSLQISPSDLELREDKKPVTITAVSPLGRLPIHYCLLFDHSGSGAKEFDMQKNGAAAVLSRVVHPDTDTGWVVLFSDTAQESTETKDPQPILNLIEQQIARGGTALYDAMANCSERMKSSSRGNELRIMFVVSDGGDDASYLNHNQVGDRIIGAGIRVYAIAPQFDAIGRRNIEFFTRLTGGRQFETGSEKKINEAADHIAQDLTNTLEITYRSTDSGGPDHTVSLQLKTHRKGISLRLPEKRWVEVR